MSEQHKLFRMLFSSEVKGDLLVLFHKNPGLMDTFEGVARRIGRIGEAISADVRDLVTLGVLKTRQVGGRQVIFLDRSKDKATQDTIVGYLKGLKTAGDA